MRKSVILISILTLPIVYVISCNNSKQTTENTISFEKKLSRYHLYSNAMKLKPSDGVEILELSSTLFTDYAEKQRLLKLPKGTRVIVKDNGLPVFPEGTIIAKTFYYTLAKSNSRKLVETRLLMLKNAKWNTATFKWNDQQTEAYLLTEGAEVPVDILHDNEKMHINYRIPSQSDCSSCHRSNNEILPLGPKVRNLNVEVEREGVRVNQLKYLADRRVMGMINTSKIKGLPSYLKDSTPLAERARAYLDINCAHCHNPNGFAGNSTLDLKYETDYSHTGIQFNKSNIAVRMELMGEFHMPKIGTTVVDRDGVDLVKNYLKSLNK